MRYCSHCGKEIADEAVICLHCGCMTQPSGSIHPQPAAQPTNTVIVEDTESSLATWSKICGILSFFIGWFALGITAIVLANLSKDDTGGVMSSSAKVGYVCGIISTVLSAVLIFLLIVILAVIVS